MPSIADAMTPAAFVAIDRQCLAKMAAVSVVSDDAVRAIERMRARFAARETPSWRERADLYQACYRFRQPIADMRFIARVLIALAEATPLLRREGGGPGRIRAWAASNPFSNAAAAP
ncbi:MAG: hypothetical protein NTV97_23690 [Alphaproteobacteria bacterium]|nr:hypothetical protein [Alphaproteobacteria bacterium]